jgi:hypothetical protein
MPTILMAPEQLPPWTLRTEIPTVVADLCEDACDLAVWRAIRWLIALSGRDRLGIDARTIAAHAKVDVKTALRCINGDSPHSAAKRQPRTRKRGLVALELLEVVGTQTVGKLKPRQIYRIPRWIEEQNAHYTRELLARLGLAPLTQAPPPGQTALPLSFDPNSEQGATLLDPNSEQGATLLDPNSEQADSSIHAYHATSKPVRHLLDPNSEQADEATVITGQVIGTSETLLDPYVDQAGRLLDPHTDQADSPVPNLDQARHLSDLAQQEAENRCFESGSLDPYSEQGALAAATLLVPNSDHWREGGKEGRREGSVTTPANNFSAGSAPNLTVAPQAPTVAAITGPRFGEGLVQRLGSLDPPKLPTLTTFADHPQWVPGTLPAHPVDLWRRACSTWRPIDDDQLALLASEHDATTEGHGWYWVGRAILAAALVEEVRALTKVRRTLERWRAEDSYGSDVPTSRRPAPVAAASLARPENARAPHAAQSSLSARLGLGSTFEEV